MTGIVGACGADELANSLTTSLVAGQDFSLPDVDLDGPEFSISANDEGLSQTVVHLTNADLTSGTVAGQGTFDTLMRGARSHIQEEFEKGRITGEQYAKVYMAMIESAMSTSVQFLLGRDQAYWQAVTARLAAFQARATIVTARVQLEIAKVELQKARLDALRSQAEFALTKMKISSESMAYCLAKFNLDSLMPVNLKMLNEQYEAARSQTLDTRSDGVTIVGTVGKQKDLYTQQIVSYKRDSEVKVAKLFTDAWTVQKTIDEGLLAPVGFTNASLDTVLSKVKLNNGLS